MSRIRSTASVISLVFGILLAVLALIFFAMPFVAVLTKTYEGGEEAFGAFFFYLLFAAPAMVLLVASAWLRGWKEARVRYITLAVLLGIPLVVGVFAVGSALYDSVVHKQNA